MSGDPRRAHPRRIIAGVDLGCFRASSNPAPQLRVNIGQDIVDISDGGARLRLTEPAQAGDPLIVELKDRRSGETFRARGEVRWYAARRTAPASTHYVGVQFSEVYTPVGQRERFTTGAAKTPVETILKPEEKRQALRFSIQDYVVTCLRQGTLAAEGLKRNLARQVLDLSRSGCQLYVTETLDIGSLVRFTLHLNQFGDTLESAGEVRWCRPDAMNYRVGVRFVNLSDDKRKKIDFMMKLFSRPSRK
jgi:c-di-GMP-binding flagellar brake protein YcgR